MKRVPHHFDAPRYVDSFCETRSPAFWEPQAGAS
jgi:hypothetical protein